jgi:hypothetical protein
MAAEASVNESLQAGCIMLLYCCCQGSLLGPRARKYPSIVRNAPLHAAAAKQEAARGL